MTDARKLPFYRKYYHSRLDEVPRDRLLRGEALRLPLYPPVASFPGPADFAGAVEKLVTPTITYSTKAGGVGRRRGQAIMANGLFLLLVLDDGGTIDNGPDINQVFDEPFEHPYIPSVDVAFARALKPRWLP